MNETDVYTTILQKIKNQIIPLIKKVNLFKPETNYKINLNKGNVFNNFNSKLSSNTNKNDTYINNVKESTDFINSNHNILYIIYIIQCKGTVY